MEDIELIDFEMEPFASIINCEEFYFQKGREALNRWLNYSLDNSTQKRLFNCIKNYNTFKTLNINDELFDLKELFFEIISYCDLHANNKENYNKYPDKRVLAKAGVRMSPWVNHLYNYKYLPEKTNITIKNALDLLNDPINNINSISVTHRQLISEYYLKSHYNKLTFVDSLKKHFVGMPTPKVAENSTILIASILYNQKEKWMPKPKKFKDFTDAFKKYLAEENLPFQVVKESENWFWITDSEGNFNSEEIHYELIIEKNQIDIDLHFEKSEETAQYYQSLIGSLPDFLRWKKWDEWGNCISHIEQVNLDDIDGIENAISYLNELYDYTIEFYRKDKRAMKEKVRLLKYKKQIILQGPPGTGKTRLAKEITSFLIPDEIQVTKDNILSFIKEGINVCGRKMDTIYTIKKINQDSVLLSTGGEDRVPKLDQIFESYQGKLWELDSQSRKSNTLSYADAIAKYIYNNLDKEFCKIIQFHPSYTYEDFVRGIVTVPNEDGRGVLYKIENKVLADFAQKASEDPGNNYVLIIDEINRANLSSVLGELIYALEYRGEAVESMYAVGNDNKLVLPPNLYLIGTMNTADRSVGHIDYAIRRRFAFVDVLPERLNENDEIFFNGEDFDIVSALFTKEFVSDEFEAKDIQLGHSFFIVNKKDVANENKAKEIFALKMKYEVLPILREYLKDGIFTEAVQVKIRELEIKYTNE